MHFDILSALNTTTLVANLRTVVGPILLLVIGGLSVRFLMRQQLSKFIVFIVIAILVLILFYSDLAVQLAQGIGKEGFGVNVGTGTTGTTAP